MSAAELIAAAAVKTKPVIIRGAELLIRELSVAGRDAFLAAVRESPAKAAVAVILYGVIHSETKQPLLTEQEAAELEHGSAEFVQELAQEILAHSGLAGDKEGNE